jgi:hypothetical protein
MVLVVARQQQRRCCLGIAEQAQVGGERRDRSDLVPFGGLGRTAPALRLPGFGI